LEYNYRSRGVKTGLLIVFEIRTYFTEIAILSSKYSSSIIVPYKYNPDIYFAVSREKHFLLDNICCIMELI